MIRGKERRDSTLDETEHSLKSRIKKTGLDTMSGLFSGLWGAEAPKPTAKELVKEQKKEIRKSQRQIERETRALEKQEKQLLADIKKQATLGNTGVCPSEATGEQAVI